ncbi:hypothetical protein SAMN02745176_01728 [Lutispora thermophila DSM 19022]|uniref:Uncharacterized protein n=2 Tax=Lutispora TaxID=667112 RepID=A0A1M6EVP2_9FIRM|nr:hypothetical protein SAMN02745176_01728 [Lutispora thermophila DSM 19022]
MLYYVRSGNYSMDLDLTFEKLIKKQAKYESTVLGLNLLISRLQKKYSINQSPEELQICLQEMKAFFEKFGSILEKDMEALKKL